MIDAVIIGFGKMGKIRYDAMIRHGGYNITAVCDVNEESMADYPCKKYSDWEKCLDETKPEAVIVCTFNNAIPNVVCNALERGIHVFSEKPPGRTLADAKTMRETAKNSSGKELKFGFNHRYHNSVIEAKALIDSRILGDIVCIRGVYGKAGSETFAREWRNDVNISGGGILLDQGIHMLDLLRYFLGDFTSVTGAVNQLVWDGLPTEDSAFALLKTDAGKIASLHSNAIQWKHKFDMDIICTEGYIELDGLLTSTKSYGEERLSYYRKDLEMKTGGLGNPIEHTMCFDTDNSWNLEIAEFYDAVRNGSPIVNGTPEDAVKVMELVEKIYSAGRGDSLA
ncbi:oxidoreductase [Clostridia bacterium]|nr:oxidoreductase [Clostridia bacterium]